MPAPSFSRRLALLSVCLAAWLLTPTSGSAADELDLARYRGQVVVLDFWASWCKPCRQSIPWLNDMRSRYQAQGLTVIGVNVDALRGDAEKFLGETPANFPILFDPRGELARRFDVKGMPSTYVFDRDGALVSRHLGFQTARTSTRETELRTLLEKNSQ